MEIVDKGGKFIQEQTKTLFENIEKQALEIGDECDKFMDNTSANKRYVCEVLLRVPLLLIIYQWLLISPYSNYWIIELFLLAVRYGVALLLVGTWAFNTGVLLQVYTLLTVDLAISWLKKTDYWTNQDEAFGSFHQKKVFVWSDCTESWLIPMICSILLHAFYLYCRLGAFVHRGNERILPWINVALVATLVPNILSAFGLFPSFISELAYWIESTFMVTILIFEVISTIDIDINVDRKKLMMLNLKQQLTYDEQARFTYKTRIKELKQRIKKRSRERNYADRFPGIWIMRDTISAVGVLYLLLSLLVELTIFKRPVFTILTVETLLEVFSAWCTSHDNVVFIGFGMGFTMDILLLAFSHLFLTADIDIVRAIICLVLSFGLFTCTVANFFSLHFIETLEAMKIVIFFSFYVIVFQTLDLLEKKILQAAVNSVSFPGGLYYRSHWNICGLLQTAPSLSTIIVSRHLTVSPWLLFFASGNCTLILRTLTLGLECSIVSCAWYTTTHLNTFEDLIYYTQTSKSIGLIILNGFQSYCRYICPCPLFKGCWFMRLCLALLSFAAVADYLGTSEYTRFKDRYKRKNLVEYLQDVNLQSTEAGDDENKDPQECAICYAVIIEGKALPCKHIFHKNCLRRWFQVKAVCPLCRSET